MLISEMIAELQERLSLYGDATVVFRDFCGGMDVDVLCAFFDQDDGKMILSDFYSPF